MSVSAWSQYWNRSAQVLRSGIISVIKMEGADQPPRHPKTLFALNSPEDVRQFSYGCDSDWGGTSSVNFAMEQTTFPEGTRPTAKLWGEVRLDVRPDSKLPKGGYAAIKSKNRTSIFGTITDSVELHDYLRLRVRLGGDPSTHNSYFLNLTTDSAFSTDLWQHRIYFQKKDNTWEDIFIPFRSFVMTEGGNPLETTFKMCSAHKIKNVGISLLAGHSNSTGKYELGIDSFAMVNEEDTSPPPRHKNHDEV